MSSGSGGSALFCFKAIEWCGKKVWLILKVPGEELGQSSNRVEKVFYWTVNGSLVGGSINLRFLAEF